MYIYYIYIYIYVYIYYIHIYTNLPRNVYICSNIYIHICIYTHKIICCYDFFMFLTYLICRLVNQNKKSKYLLTFRHTIFLLSSLYFTFLHKNYLLV